MDLVFATHNKNKLIEVQALIPPSFQLLSLEDIGCKEDIPETGKTLAENAQLKADYVTKTYDIPCFADDTGLLVDALNGAPGVYSARYAGPEKDSKANIDKLLGELKPFSNRTAQFETVIALNLKDETHLFKGMVKGEIIHAKKGNGGFGYDPIFRPYGYDQTFAELPLKAKNDISHRGRAIVQLVRFLSDYSAG